MGEKIPASVWGSTRKRAFKKRAHPERDIQNAIIDLLRHKNVFCWRQRSSGNYCAEKGFFLPTNKYEMTGTSDILGIMKDGRFLAIEVKTKGGKASDAQNRFLENIQKNNGIAFVARSVEDVTDHLRFYLA